MPSRAAYDVSVEATGETYPLACTQIQHTYMGRDSVVKETSFDDYLAEAGVKRGDASWNKTIGLNVHDDINGDGELSMEEFVRGCMQDKDLVRMLSAGGLHADEAEADDHL